MVFGFVNRGGVVKFIGFLIFLDVLVGCWGLERFRGVGGLDFMVGFGE